MPKNDNENKKLSYLRSDLGLSEGFDSYLRLLDLSGPARNLQDSYGHYPSYGNWSWVDTPNGQILDTPHGYMNPIPGDTRVYSVFMDPMGKWLITDHLYEEYVHVVCEVIIGRISKSQIIIIIDSS